MIIVSRRDKKIGLSIRNLDETEEKEVYRGYMGHRDKATSNLGELLRKGMMDLENQASSEDEEVKNTEKETEETQGQEELSSEDVKPENAETV